MRTGLGSGASYRALGVLAVAVCAASGCGGGGDAADGVVRRDSLGVAVVDQPGVDRDLGVRLVAGARLIDPDSALAPRPWGVGVHPESGALFVADAFARSVHVFDGDGAYVRTFGRPGEGPGEFGSPSALAVADDGSVVVLDTGRGLLSRWSADGDLLDERPMPFEYWGPGFAALPDGWATVRLDPEPGAEAVEQQLLVSLGTGVHVLHEVVQPVVRTDLPCGGGPVTMPVVLAPDVVWTHHRGSVFHRVGPGYRVDVWRDGDRVASHRRAVEPVSVTPALATEAVLSGPGPYRGFLRRCDITPEALVAAVGYQERVSPIMGMAVAPDGRLWLTRTADGVRPTAYDVVGPDGVYAGSVEAPGFLVAVPAPDRLLILRLEPTGGLDLRLWRVEHADREAEGPGP
ncbi:MAG: 6-bladed beta-propeller [Longimicrobiales bacterium]